MGKKVTRQRADVILHRRGLCASRELARKLIMSGQVRIGRDRVIKKASELVAQDADLRILSPSPYVSRGAYKLLPGLEKYLDNLDGLTVLDVGASTGGFTDLMLQKGAQKVYAVDVGYGQLHDKLRRDPRVVSLEKVNARYLSADLLPEEVDVITMDVSFISVTRILPVVNHFLKSESGWAFILVKPQFEAGPAAVGKGGVVREEQVRQACVRKIVDFVTAELHWLKLDVIKSPVKGPKGNQEYLLICRKTVETAQG